MPKKLAREQTRTKLPVAVPETSGAMAHLKSFLRTLQARSVRTKFLCYFSRTGINRNQSRTLFGVPNSGLVTSACPTRVWAWARSA
jgi:hypothetical protein